MDDRTPAPPPPTQTLPPPPGIPAPALQATPLAPSGVPGRPSRAPLIVAVVVGLAVFAVVAAMLAGGGSNPDDAAPATTTSEPDASPTPEEPTTAPTTEPDGGGGSQGLPASIAGAPRLSGTAGEAAEEFMRAYIGDEPTAVALYGTLRRPAFLYVVFGDSTGAQDLPLPEFLELSAAAGGIELRGEVSSRSEGDVSAACATADDPDLRFLCVTVDDETVDMLMGFLDTGSPDQLDAAIEAAG